MPSIAEPSSKEVLGSATLASAISTLGNAESKTETEQKREETQVENFTDAPSIFSASENLFETTAEAVESQSVSPTILEAKGDIFRGRDVFTELTIKNPNKTFIESGGEEASNPAGNQAEALETTPSPIKSEDLEVIKAGEEIKQQVSVEKVAFKNQDFLAL